MVTQPAWALEKGNDKVANSVRGMRSFISEISDKVRLSAVPGKIILQTNIC